jgi:hypothetical protein
VVARVARISGELASLAAGTIAPRHLPFVPVDLRTRIFVIIAAYLGAAAGLAYSMTYDLLCMCPGTLGPCGCVHDEIFGWQPGALAYPVWTAIGLVGAGIVGFLAARVTGTGRSATRPSSAPGHSLPGLDD